MLLVFAMKCCTKMLCPLPHNHYCYSLPSPVCLLHLLVCTCFISSPIACPPSSVLCWYLLFLFSYFCDMLHFFVSPFWLVCVHIFSFILHFHSVTFNELFVVFSVHFDLIIIVCWHIGIAKEAGTHTFLKLLWQATITTTSQNPLIHHACAW